MRIIRLIYTYNYNDFEVLVTSDALARVLLIEKLAVDVIFYYSIISKCKEIFFFDFKIRKN